MKFEPTVWSIGDLLELYTAENLDLSPPYQRNPVWTVKAQQKLLESVLSGKPIPNFFLLKKDNGKYEMIDGQQRARTIIGYFKGLLVDHENLTFEHRLNRAHDRQLEAARFLNYRLSVTVVSNLTAAESIEEYYALLNSSGLRLNRPELKKAEYFTTNFLALVMQCTSDERLQALRLFNAMNTTRMNDVDFVSELLAAIKFGISDKKEKVDMLYEDDVSPEEAEQLRKSFSHTLDVFTRLNAIVPVCRTRYKQKNDFFTLFYFYYSIRDLSSLVHEHFYRVLWRVGPHIRPSQEFCEPLRNYAYNCVTQSNSRNARQARHDFLKELFLNTCAKPTATQEALIRFFHIPAPPLTNVAGFWTLPPEHIADPHNLELELESDEV
jgi:hypothetical protein